MRKYVGVVAETGTDLQCAVMESIRGNRAVIEPVLIDWNSVE